MTIVISNLRNEQNGAGFDTSVDVAQDGDHRTLTISRTGNHPRLGEWQPRYDPFLVALILPAMMRRRPVVVEGPVSATLLQSAQTSIQATLRTLNRGWRHVTIDAEPVRDTRIANPSLGAATGMSCGIDSLYTYAGLMQPGVEEQLRPKLFLHNDVGAHPDRGIFERHLVHVQRFAAEAGVPLVSISADLEPWYGGRFIHSHTIRNAAAAMTVDHLFHSYVYSSSEEIGRTPKLGRLSGMSTLDPTLLPLFDTPATKWLSYGSHATRLEKTGHVMSLELARRYLTVCIRDPRAGDGRLNCGRCYKCARALAYADAEGILDQFGAVFDIEAYRKHRDHALFRFLRHSIGDRRSDTDLEMLAWLDRRRTPMPWWMEPFLPLVRRRAAKAGL